MDEKKLIKYVRENFEIPSYLLTKFDNDCEILDLKNVAKDKLLTISIDTTSDKADFPVETPCYLKGYFSISLALSDIAACGAEPIGVLTSINIPYGYKEREVKEIYRGIKKAVKDSNTFLLGGDTNCSNELSISVVALGICEKEKIMRREFYEKNGIVGVTGYLDRYNYEAKKYKKFGSCNFEKMLMQQAPLLKGYLLSSSGVKCCIDTPDGLLKSLKDLKSYGFLIYDEKIPLLHFYEENMKRYKLASEPAGDIELLFIANPSDKKEIEELFEAYNFEIYWIGKVVEKDGIFIKTSEGIEKPSIKGFIHSTKKKPIFE